MAKKLFAAILFAGVLISCDSSDSNNESEKIDPKNISLELSKEEKVVSGEKVTITIKSQNDFKPDSTILYIDGLPVVKQQNPSFVYNWPTENQTMGDHLIKIKSYKGGEIIKKKKYATIISDIKPEIWSYKVLKTYPHDPNNYTQGLEYSNTYFYESTGRRGKSIVRHFDLETGNTIKSSKLDSKYFGEGITRVDRLLYQITWTSNKGWIYDPWEIYPSHEFTFKSESGEGWGLTNNGKEIIMSDGSNFLNFIEPAHFVNKRSIEVYDDKGPVENLNELEYHDGLVYANIFMNNDKIVVIDPQTGKVVAYITGFEPLKKENDPFIPEEDQHECVLNGIAYYKDNQHFIITGKCWSKLYEIEIIKNAE